MHVDPVAARYRLGAQKGHYESWFIRGNHPTRPLAFWIRYTVTSPRGRSSEAVAELFAAIFDGEARRHVATRESHPVREATFPTEGLDVRIGAAHLTSDHLVGAAARPGHRVAWDIHVHGGGEPLYLLPERLYDGGFPKAKALVIRPGVTFDGHVDVGAEGAATRLDVGGWVGSTNHNWGSKHTDHYVWGQVAGFDDAPDAFLEIATARIRVAGVLTPPMTPIVLRLDGREHRLNALHTVFGRARLDGLVWSFKAKGPGIELAGTMRMRPDDFVVFAYHDPPGGVKTCINSKIAACELSVTVDGRRREFRSASRAAMEILVDDPRTTGVAELPLPV